MEQISDMSDKALLALLVGKRAASNLSEKPLYEIFGFDPKSTETAVQEDIADYKALSVICATKELLTRCFLEKMASGEALTSPEIVKKYLCSRIGHLEHEVFWCLWLDAQNCLINAEQIFRGTLDQANVYPRELAKRALALNAASVILAHNHPSGRVEPSNADQRVTRAIKSVLSLLEIKVIDHVIVSGINHYSFAEKGDL